MTLTKNKSQLSLCIANEFIRKYHYSGKVVNNSNLHFGAFLDDKLYGVLSYGPSLDKSKMLRFVK